MNCTGYGCSKRKHCTKHVFLRSGAMLFDPPDKPDDCDLYAPIPNLVPSKPKPPPLDPDLVNRVVSDIKERERLRKRAIELNPETIANREGVSVSTIYRIRSEYYAQRS